MTKTKIYKTHEKKPEQIQLEEEEGFDQREHPGMGSIIKDEYHAVKEKIGKEFPIEIINNFSS